MNADQLALAINEMISKERCKVQDVLVACLTLACFAAKASGMSVLQFQKVIVKNWSDIPSEVKSVQ